MMVKAYPNREELLAILRYKDGNLYWVRSLKRHALRGKLAGCLEPGGYWVIQHNGRRLYAHRLIWILHHGNISAGLEIDHINRLKSDNRIENLRLVTKVGNGQNRTLSRNNTTGIPNVYKDQKCWRYIKQFAGRKIDRSFATKEEAIQYAETLNVDFSADI
jgi:hypothetical protein